VPEGSPGKRRTGAVRERTQRVSADWEAAVHIGPQLSCPRTRRTQFISSLIESWGSDTEQTQAQSGSEPKEN